MQARVTLEMALTLACLLMSCRRASSPKQLPCSYSQTLTGWELGSSGSRFSATSLPSSTMQKQLPQSPWLMMQSPSQYFCSFSTSKNCSLNKLKIVLLLLTHFRENAHVRYHILEQLSLLDGCLFHNLAESASVQSKRPSRAVSNDSSSPWCIIHQRKLTKCLPFFIGLQVFVFAPDDLKAVVLALRNNVKAIALIPFVNNVIALLVRFLLHGIDDRIFLIDTQVCEQDGAPNEAKDELFGVLGLRNAPEFDGVLLIEVPENLFGNTHSASLLASLLGLLETGIIEWDLLGFALAVGFGMHVLVGSFGCIEYNSTQIVLEPLRRKGSWIGGSLLDDLVDHGLHEHIDVLCQIILNLFPFALHIIFL